MCENVEQFVCDIRFGQRGLGAPARWERKGEEGLEGKLRVLISSQKIIYV